MNALTHHVLHGDVIGPGDGVTVVGRTNPLRARDIGPMVLPPGLTVAEMMAIAVPLREGWAKRLVVTLGGDPIPEALWHRVRPKPRTVLSVRGRVEGGMGRTLALIGVAVAALVATIALPILAPAFLAGITAATGGLLGATAIAGLVGAAISIAGSLAVNALFPIAQPQLANVPTNGGNSQVFSIGAGRNATTPFAPVPQILGTHRIYPVTAAKPFTELVGPDQYLRLLYLIGYGELDIDLSSMKIGETPLSSYDDVEYEVRYGTGSDAALSLFSNDVDEVALQVELPADTTYVNRLTTTGCDEVSVDFVAPNGLFWAEDGSAQLQTVEVLVVADYRLNGGAWHSLGSNLFSGSSSEMIRFGMRVRPGGNGQFEVRARRATSHSTQPGTIQDTIYWTAIRGVKYSNPVAFAKPVALIALRIRATNQLNGTIDNFNVVASQRVKHWTGSLWSSNQISSNPGDLIRHILQGPANARPVADSAIDLTSLAAFAARCTSKGYTYNNVLTTQDSVWNRLKEVAAAGRGVVLFRDGLWSVSYEDGDLSPPIVQHFTPRNSWGFSFTRAYKNLPHGWRCKFVNAAQGYQQDEVIVYADGYDGTNATIFESYEMPGVTTVALIHKHAKFNEAQVKLRPDTFTLTVDWENLVCQRNDRVLVAHDVIEVGLNQGRIKAIVAYPIGAGDGRHQLTIDNTVVMAGGGLYGVQLRLADGTALEYSVETHAGEQTTLILPTTASTLPAVGDLFLFGNRNLESIVCRVLAIEPGPDLTATLTLVDDAPAIATADSGPIPAYDSHISLPVNPLFQPPSDVRATEYLYHDSSGAHAGAQVTWQVTRFGEDRSFEVQWQRGGSSTAWHRAAVVPVPATSYGIGNLVPGTYSFRVRALFSLTRYSAWATVTNVSLNGLLATPDQVPNFRIGVSGRTATLSWNAIRAVNFSHYVIRFSPRTSGVTWATSSILLPHVTTTSAQVPARSGTYLIKAVTQQGIESGAPRLVVSNVTSRANVIQVIDEGPAFAGSKSGVLLDAGTLRLDATADMFALADFFRPADMFLSGGPMTLMSVAAGAPSDGAAVPSPLFSPGTYSFAGSLDLGAVYTSRVTASIDAYGELLTSDFFSQTNVYSAADFFGFDNSQWSVDLQVRTTLDNPAGSPTWTDWETMVAGDYLARAFQFQAILSSLADQVTPRVADLVVTIDMPDRIEGGNDIAVPAGGLTVSFVPPFKALRAFSTNDQGLATGDFKAVTAKTATGFTIRYFNSAGTGVARTFDYTAVGYGEAA